MDVKTEELKQRYKDMRQKRWHILYTAPKTEKSVEKRLLIEGVQVYLPLYLSKRKWSDRVKLVELPLFNSYIFVYCSENDVRSLVITPGVVKVVFYLGKPAVVKEVEIDAIKEFINIAEGCSIISEGDVVNILGGPLEKKSGEVLRINEKIITLYIETLGTVCVEIGKVEKKK